MDLPAQVSQNRKRKYEWRLMDISEVHHELTQQIMPYPDAQQTLR